MHQPVQPVIPKGQAQDDRGGAWKMNSVWLVLAEAVNISQDKVNRQDATERKKAHCLLPRPSAWFQH